MNVKKLIKYTSIILIAVLLVTFSTSCKTNREPPTVKLEIYEGPEYTTGFCVYRIEAVVTGYPEPEVTFSRNDGSLGENRCQVNLESSQEPYLLEATAENSMGEATASLLLEWGCEEETEKARINSLTEQYPEAMSKIEAIQDQAYKEAILADDNVIQAIDFFDSYGHVDILLEKRVALHEFGITHLYDILKDEDKEMIDDYIKNVTDLRNDNAIAFIWTSNSTNFTSAFTAYIASSFNLPYFIVHYKDGDSVTSELGFTLDSLEEDWTHDTGVDPSLAFITPIKPYLEQIEKATKEGNLENIKIDKTKDEVLGYLENILKDYDTVYFFISTHAGYTLSCFSSQGHEKMEVDDIYSKLSVLQKKINFKLIGGHCYDLFEEDLEKKFEDNKDNLKNLEYGLLSASTGMSNTPNLQQAIDYSNDGIVTIKELQDIGNGVGAIKKVDEIRGRKICIFDTKYPDYENPIDCDGPLAFKPVLRTNSTDKSIFYIKPKYFNK